MKEEIIGTIKKFEGYFDLYKTDNIFQFLKFTNKNRRISKKSIVRIGRIHPRVEINMKGVIVGTLNKKEGLFVCKKYPLSIFKFYLPDTKLTKIKR